MIKEIEKLSTTLLEIKGTNISDVKIEGGKLLFKFCGGKFVFFKSVSADLQVGYLNLYHETPLSGANQLIEVKDFVIKLTLKGNGLHLKITSYIDYTNDIGKPPIDEEGCEDVDYETLLAYFPKHLRAKLIKDNFRIYIS